MTGEAGRAVIAGRHHHLEGHQCRRRGRLHRLRGRSRHRRRPESATSSCRRTSSRRAERITAADRPSRSLGCGLAVTQNVKIDGTGGTNPINSMLGGSRHRPDLATVDDAREGLVICRASRRLDHADASRSDHPDPRIRRGLQSAARSTIQSPPVRIPNCRGLRRRYPADSGRSATRARPPTGLLQRRPATPSRASRATPTPTLTATRTVDADAHPDADPNADAKRSALSTPTSATDTPTPTETSTAATVTPTVATATITPSPSPSPTSPDATTTPTPHGHADGDGHAGGRDRRSLQVLRRQEGFRVGRLPRADRQLSPTSARPNSPES